MPLQKPDLLVAERERGERRIDVRRLRDSNGRRVPTVWDSERGEYRVDARRVDPEDIDLAIFDAAQP